MNNTAHLDNEPDPQYRLPDQEIRGQGDEEAPVEENQEAVEQQPENFNFENRQNLKELVKMESNINEEMVPMEPADVSNMDNLREHLAEIVEG